MTERQTHAPARQVDVHAHWLPRTVADTLEQAGHPPLRRTDPATLDDRLETLDAAGTDTQIIGLGALQPYGPDLATATRAARTANEVYAAELQRHGDRFAAFGTLPLAHPDAAAAEAEYCLDQLAFPGLGLGCSIGGLALDAAGLDPLWALLDDRRAVIHLHPGTANTCAVGIADYPMLLGPVFGSPVETAVAVVRLVLGGVTTRFPGIRFVAAGLGGSLPDGWAKLRRNAGIAAAVGETREADLPALLERELRRFLYDTSTLEDRHRVAVPTAYGTDRLVLGTDAPWGDGATAAATLTRVLGEHEAARVRTRGAELLPG